MSWSAEAANGASEGASAAGSGALDSGAGSAANSGSLQVEAPQAQASPSFMDQAMNGLERFQKGGSQSMPQAYKNFGNNPETYGWAVSKAGGMGGSGGGAPPAMTTVVNYQQPQNDYLRKRRGY